MPSTTSWPDSAPADPEADGTLGLTEAGAGPVQTGAAAGRPAGQSSRWASDGPYQDDGLDEQVCRGQDPGDQDPGDQDPGDQDPGGLDPGGLAIRLDHRFGDPALLEQALAHRSWCGEQGTAASNERLEFLGDAVLGLAVAEHAYERFPDLPEGQLAKIRSAVVNARVLAELAEDLDVGPELLLGRGEETTGGRSKGSILADAFEALIGAVYLDGGWAEARRIVLQLLSDRIEAVSDAPDGYDHKSRLQELAVRRGVGTPRYVLEGSGPDHDRRFRAEVTVGGSVWGTGEGTSKKDAEQHAARQAFEALQEQ